MAREGGRKGEAEKGAANTFNNIERVYSRAIAFSNRRCSVPLESMLPTSQVCTRVLLSHPRGGGVNSGTHPPRILAYPQTDKCPTPPPPGGGGGG